MRERNPESTRCTAILRSGRFCDAESLPDAPFPICVKHAARVLEYLNDYCPRDFESRILVAVRAAHQSRAVEAERVARKPAPDGRVYYIRVGNLVKIGYSERLTLRLAQYPPDSKLLAVEHGTISLEVQRHNQFSQYRAARNEWYHPAPELMAHIEQVREASAA